MQADDVHRRRGRSVGTLIIGAIIVAAVIYTVFGHLGSTPMPAPHVIGGAATSLWIS